LQKYLFREFGVSIALSKFGQSCSKNLIRKKECLFFQYRYPLALLKMIRWIPLKVTPAGDPKNEDKAIMRWEGIRENRIISPLRR